MLWKENDHGWEATNEGVVGEESKGEVEGGYVDILASLV